MDKSIKEKYKLPEQEHMEIYRRIEQEVFSRASTQEKPIGIIVGAQPGSGKGSVISYSKRQVEEKGKDITIITTDEYKPYHPQAIEIAQKYPTDYVEIVEQDAGAWTGKVLRKAIDDKYNFIFEGTLKNERILDRIKEMKQNGFSVIVRALAVPRLESLISIHERYENQMQNMGWGRLISVEHHDQAYNGVPATIDAIEKSGLCTIEIFIRGEEISRPQKVYSSAERNDTYPTARIALEEYRNRERQKTLATAQQRINALKKQFVDRGAHETEMQQLERLEQDIFQDMTK